MFFEKIINALDLMVNSKEMRRDEMRMYNPGTKEAFAEKMVMRAVRTVSYGHRWRKAESDTVQKCGRDHFYTSASSACCLLSH